jgi:hypothetical protein
VAVALGNIGDARADDLLINIGGADCLQVNVPAGFSLGHAAHRLVGRPPTYTCFILSEVISLPMTRSYVVQVQLCLPAEYSETWEGQVVLQVTQDRLSARGRRLLPSWTAAAPLHVAARLTADAPAFFLRKRSVRWISTQPRDEVTCGPGSRASSRKIRVVAR